MGAFNSNAFQNNAFSTGTATSASLTVVASGGITILGSPQKAYGKVKIVGGGFVSSGAATIISSFGAVSRLVAATGGFILQGYVPNVRTKTKTGSGGITLSGNTSSVKFPDNSPVVTRNFKRGRRPRTHT